MHSKFKTNLILMNLVLHQQFKLNQNLSFQNPLPLLPLLLPPPPFLLHLLLLITFNPFQIVLFPPKVFLAISAHFFLVLVDLPCFLLFFAILLAFCYLWHAINYPWLFTALNFLHLSHTVLALFNMLKNFKNDLAILQKLHLPYLILKAFLSIHLKCQVKWVFCFRLVVVKMHILKQNTIMKHMVPKFVLYVALTLLKAFKHFENCVVVVQTNYFWKVLHAARIGKHLVVNLDQVGTKHLMNDLF
mmetsp:Transcript_8438/g.12840  ORF Transcript_8438/g.12840 Transcript_8438/m.12840 type:complete len:245 (+) Transcript_8438:71-805(+)